MDYLVNTLVNLLEASGFYQITYKNLIMIAVACFLLYLAIKKDYEPLLLIPIAFGMLLVNLFPGIMAQPSVNANGDVVPGGLLRYFYLGDEYGIWPSLIFLGVGAMTDFGPLIANPSSFLLGAAAQFGIYAAYFGAVLLGFTDGAAASNLHNRRC